MGSVSCSAASPTSAVSAPQQQQQQSAVGKSLQLTFSRRSQVRLLIISPFSLSSGKNLIRKLPGM